MNYKIYDIKPVTKPRMTRRDKWEHRPCVMRYRAFKDEIRDSGLAIPDAGYHVIFVLPMPKSWSGKKMDSARNKPHLQTPDKDNLEKALLDALYQNDAHIWDGRVSKVWGDEGKIIVIADMAKSWIKEFLDGVIG